MMILRTSTASPFGRKARIAAAVLGLDKKIDVRHADGSDPNDPIRTENPLGKMPVLTLEDGTYLYDSPVILEYFDVLAGGGRIIPKETAARFAALRLQALGDGLMDASVLLMYEQRFRAEDRRESKWIEHQTAKVSRALAALEKALPAVSASPDVGQITLACALGYLDFRFAGEWRKQYPKLVQWLDAFAAKVPAYAATTPA
ncbi:MAG: glutathione S-transferase family protein [Variibacter sp.]